MASVYVERRVGEIYIGYTYFVEDNSWQITECIGELKEVQSIGRDEVPDAIVKAVSILLEGELG